MAHYTTNLNLYEKDPTTDGSQLFSITTMMNDNFDKIDTAVGNLGNLTTSAKTNIVGAINEVNAKDALPSQTGYANRFLATNGTTASWEYAPAGLPIGTVFSVVCTADYVPNGALPCDGSEYSKTQFSDLWTNYLTPLVPLLKTCSYADYSTAISTYGSCPMFAVDTTNNKFKVPTIKDGAYITQAKSDSELGKSYNESLPNIEGTIESVFTGSSSQIPTGVFADSTYLVGAGYTSGSDSKRTINFSANSYSSTYQDNAKVQGDNIRLRYFVQVATGQINQSQMDWSAWATSLQSKLNTDHTNDTVPYLKTTYVNGTSGYNIWSNGYCEQWGQLAGSSSVVTYLKTFANTNYNLQDCSITSSTGTFHPICASKSTTGCVLFLGQYNTSATTDANYTHNWIAKGYLASDQY